MSFFFFFFFTFFCSTPEKENEIETEKKGDRERGRWGELIFEKVILAPEFGSKQNKYLGFDWVFGITVGNLSMLYF